VGVTVPWGIVVAIVLTSALLAGLRLVFGTRIVPAFATGGLLLTLAFLTLPSPGGSVLVPESVAGYVWALAPAIIAAFVLGLPNLHPNLPPRVSPSSAARVIDNPASKGSDLP